MKCNKGHEMSERRGDTTIEECGVEIELQDVRLFRCVQCAIETPAISRVEKLFREVAHALAGSANRLRPQELRFLRKYLGLSSRDFAQKMGVDHTTVSKWERIDDPQDMGRTAERLLRMFVLTEVPLDEYPLEAMATKAPHKHKLSAVVASQGWRLGPVG